MERLTGSPYVIDIYGFCGMTVIQEFAGKQVHETIRGPAESLKFAIQVSRGIRDIHAAGESKYPALVHNDINLANIIVTNDGRPVLNDFNSAVLLMKNKVTGKPCQFHALFPNPQWRSPEEQVEDEYESKHISPVVDEKIDVYAMGNVLYRLVAGGSPWKKKGSKGLSEEDKIFVARAKRYNGTLPKVPDSAQLDDPAIAALHEAMTMCYKFHPKERPSAAELVEFLEAAQKNISLTERMHS